MKQLNTTYNSSVLNTNYLLKIIALSFFLILISGCSTFWGNDDFAELQIIEQGKNIKNRPNMAEVCKGFNITPEKFQAFFENASITDETELNARYQSLPCYSSGIAYFENERFEWVIHAGGVGEFYNEKTNFTKVCGIACCDKVAGVC